MRLWKSSLFLVIVLAAAAVGLLWVALPGAHPLALPPAPRRQAPGDGRSASAERIHRSASGTLETQGESSRPDAGETPAPAPVGLRLRVVDAAGHQRVPRAHLFLFEGGELAGVCAQSGGPPLSAQEVARRLGAVFCADERGEALLPITRSVRFVGAEHDGLWGFRRLDPRTPSPCELVIAPFHEVRVRVLDRSAEARAGIPVVLRPCEGVVNIGPRAQFSPWRARTAGERGEARLRYLPADYRGARHPLRLEVALDLPGRAPVRKSFEIDKPPAEVLELVLPPLGGVAVRLEDPQGRSFLGPARILLGYAPRDTRDGRVGQRFFGSLTTTSGSALFSMVGLGLDLWLSVEAADGAWREVRLRGLGPSAEGEIVQFGARFDARNPIAIGCILHPDGSPAAGLSLRVLYRGASALRGTGQALRLDPQGRFRVPILARLEPGRKTTLELVLGEGLDLDGMPAGPRAIFDLPDELPAGILDLGDAVLPRVQNLLRGHIVDRAGQQVGEAEIQVYAESASPRSGARFTLVESLGARSAADGSFAIRGAWRGGPLRLVIHRERFLSKQVETLLPASGDLHIVLSRGGSIEGRLLLDEGLSFEDLSLLVEGSSRALNRTAKPDAHGRFRLATIPPGLRDVHTRLRHTIVATVPAVSVVPEQTSADPRLQPLDLRGQIAALHLEIREVHGRELRRVLLWKMAGDSLFSTRKIYPDPAGRLDLIVALEGSHYLVSAAGCMPVPVDPGSERCRALLQRGPRVRLRIAGKIPPHPKFPPLRVFIKPAEPNHDPLWEEVLGEYTPDIIFNERRESVLCLPRAGAYLLSWPEFPDCADQRIEVADLDEEQVFTLRLERR